MDQCICMLGCSKCGTIWGSVYRWWIDEFNDGECVLAACFAMRGKYLVLIQDSVSDNMYRIKQ